MIGREASDQGKERMGSSGLVRWGAVSLILGGAAWIVLGLTAVFGYLQAIPGREDVVLFGVALLLTAAGLVGLHALQGGSYGLLGRVGLYVALAAVAARISARWFSWREARRSNGYRGRALWPCWSGSCCTGSPPCGLGCCHAGTVWR